MSFVKDVHNFLVGSQVVYSWAFFSFSKSVERNSLIMSLSLDFLKNDLLACVRLRVKIFDVFSGMNSFGEAFLLVSSLFVVKTMFIEWSFDGFLWSVFNN